MPRLRALLVVFLCATVLPAVLVAQADKQIVVTGTWRFAVTSDADMGTATVTFKQKGDSISGRYTSLALGKRDFTGTFKEGKVAFSFIAEAYEEKFAMSFSGVLEGPDVMTGTIDAGVSAGTFKARRVAR